MLNQKLHSFCRFFLPVKKAASSISESSDTLHVKKPDKKTTRNIYRHDATNKSLTVKIASENGWWIN